MKKSIIIDDEPRAREMMRHLIQSCNADISVEGEASSVPEGVKLIHRIQPDIVFLDIEMPIYSGLELLDFFDKDAVRFKIIFVTAYSEYAIDAFRLAAVDYLLKPVQLDQLREAIRKAGAVQVSEIDQWRALQHNYHFPRQQQIALSLAEGLTIVDLSEIIYIQAEGAYTHIILSDNRKIVSSKLLREFVFLTEKHGFFRTGRSYIVNREKIRRIARSDNDLVVENGDRISITPEKKRELIDGFNDIRI